MKKSLLLLMGILALASCTKSKVNTEETSFENIEDKASQSLYAQTDSTFTINNKIFRVNVKQFDLTEKAMELGDTLSRPTYSCAVRIFDAGNKVIFKDSVLRDSWGYAGKFLSIDSYQITLPQASFVDPEIILTLRLYEEEQEDAMDCSIAFNINTLKPRYFLQESTSGD